MAETTIAVHGSSGRVLDAVTLELLWSRLISIVEEAETTLVRTSFSPIVGEADDHAAALLDADGNILAQSPSGLPAFIGILGRTTRTMLQYFPKETLKPDDVLITNDPWICCGHLNDINLLRPIFHKGKLIAFTANTAHMTDIGGRNSAEAVDLFEEGLRILPSKLFDGGIKNQTIYQFLAANTRMPIHIVGDLNAQLAATEIADKRLIEMLEEYDLDDIDALADEIQSRTEKITRDAISRLPDGDYYGQVNSDGFDQPLTIKVCVRIDGDELTVDYDGTSDQIDRAINCPLNLTYAETVWALRVAFAPDVPTTEGCLRPFNVVAPEGTILNPRFPASVYSRTTVVHNVHAGIFQALSSLVPEYIEPSNIQANGGCIWSFRFRGYWTEKTKPYWETQSQFVSSYIGNGGQGATGTRDGMHAMSYPDNVSNMPIEVVENRMPVIFMSKEILPDSCGAGKFRGGCGQEINLKVLSDRPIQFALNSGDKIRHAPFALHDGQVGGKGYVGRNGEALFPPRMWVNVNEGDTIKYVTPGGGGFGSPYEREPEMVLDDVRNGIVSMESARHNYGVAVSSNLSIDWDETARLRA